MLSHAATNTNTRGEHDRLIIRHDIRVVFFHAEASGRVVLIPPEGLAPDGVGWAGLEAWYGSREANNIWGNEVTRVLTREGCEQE